MILAIDHIVILVRDLEAASADYRRLGFQVVVGGEHADGASHNALVSFADGSYLELIAFRREAPEHVWWRHQAHGAGLIDFALLPGAIEQDVADARARGLEAMAAPRAGGRLRPDGVRLEWQTSRATDGDDLPFLCGDVTERGLRVPNGAAWEHPNGARGIAAVTVAVDSLERSAGRYAALLGQLPLVEPGRRSFPLGAGAIELRVPSGADPESEALAARLGARGPGIFSLHIHRGDPAAPAAALDMALAHGARISLG